MAGHQDIVQIDEDHSETGTTMSISHWKVRPALLRPKGILRNSNNLKGGYDCYLLYVPRPEERVLVFALLHIQLGKQLALMGSGSQVVN
jgi:hypothetical protein